MHLVQIDTSKRLPFADNPSGWYYWSSVYYADLDHWSNIFQLALSFVTLERLLITADAQLMRLQIHDPPGRGNIVFSEGPFTNQFGHIASEGSYSLIQVARWHLYSASGRRSYRLNRMPLRPSDWEGDSLTASGMLRQVTSLNTLIIQGFCRNSYGELLTHGEVVQRLTMWQMRHGTKRRERDPLA